jgi:hypothetical protein
MLKKKYRRRNDDLIHSLNSIKRQTVVLSIEVVETSKIKDHLIYECDYLDNGTQKQVNIIAQDITEAMQKLEPYVGVGIPEPTANLILGSQLYQKVTDHDINI